MCCSSRWPQPSASSTLACCFCTGSCSSCWSPARSACYASLWSSGGLHATATRRLRPPSSEFRLLSVNAWVAAQISSSTPQNRVPHTYSIIPTSASCPKLSNSQHLTIVLLLVLITIGFLITPPYSSFYAYFTFWWMRLYSVLPIYDYIVILSYFHFSFPLSFDFAIFNVLFIIFID